MVHPFFSSFFLSIFSFDEKGFVLSVSEGSPTLSSPTTKKHFFLCLCLSLQPEPLPIDPLDLQCHKTQGISHRKLCFGIYWFYLQIFSLAPHPHVTPRHRVKLQFFFANSPTHEIVVQVCFAKEEI